jgi:hypothetical protein
MENAVVKVNAQIQTHSNSLKEENEQEVKHFEEIILAHHHIIRLATNEPSCHLNRFCRKMDSRLMLQNVLVTVPGQL